MRLTRNCWGHSATQCRDSSHGNLLRSVLVWAGVSSCHHIRFQQGALQVDMVVGEGLVHSSQDLLCDVLATLQVMISVRQNLRLHDGDYAILRIAVNVSVT